MIDEIRENHENLKIIEKLCIRKSNKFFMNIRNSNFTTLDIHSISNGTNTFFVVIELLEIYTKCLFYYFIHMIKLSIFDSFLKFKIRFHVISPLCNQPF